MSLEGQARDQAGFGFVRQVGTLLVSRGWLTHPQLMDLLREHSMRRARRLRESVDFEGGDGRGR